MELIVLPSHGSIRVAVSIAVTGYSNYLFESISDHQRPEKGAISYNCFECILFQVPSHGSASPFISL